MQMAYAHGREAQMRDPEVLRTRPFWMYSAILDMKTTDICNPPTHGTVLPAEHPWWQTHTPPLHHNCRSIKRSLTPAQAVARGVSKKPPKEKEGPQEGFGGADPLKWQPDLKGYPPVLVRMYRKKRR